MDLILQNVKMHLKSRSMYSLCTLHKVLWTLHLLCIVISSLEVSSQTSTHLFTAQVNSTQTHCLQCDDVVQMLYVWYCVGLGFKCTAMDFIKSLIDKTWARWRHAMTLLSAFSTYFGKPHYRNVLYKQAKQAGWLFFISPEPSLTKLHSLLHGDQKSEDLWVFPPSDIFSLSKSKHKNKIHTSLSFSVIISRTDAWGKNSESAQKRNFMD